MSLIGAIFGSPGGNGPSGPGPTPPPQDPGPANDPTEPSGPTEPGSSGSSSPEAGAAGGATGTSGTQSTSGASESQAAVTPVGTPADAPAVRFDFSVRLDTTEVTEDSARAFALATQSAERTNAIVARLGEAAKNLPPEPEAPKAEAAPPAGSAYGDALQTLRGQSAPVGAVLDKAA